MTVYHVGARGGAGNIVVGYALAVRLDSIPPRRDGRAGKPWRWVEEGIVDDDVVTLPYDPTVAYDSVTRNFVLSGLTSSHPIVAIWNADLEAFEPPGWQEVMVDGELALRGDKSWIVAGEVLPPTNGGDGQQEFYIAYSSGAIAAYLRSADGGRTWNGDYVKVLDENVLGGWPCPAPHVDGSLYLAFELGGNIQFVRGEDPDHPDDAMTWARLLDDGQQLEIIVNHRVLTNYLPLVASGAHVFMFPQLAADPTNENVLYLVFHDTNPLETDPPDDVNVDVFLVKLTRDPLSDRWTASERVVVNDDVPLQGEAYDQFLPALTVDTHGRIHIIYYDDRHFPDQIDRQTEPPPKYNAYYAYSIDGGSTFINQELFKNPLVPPEEEPAADFGREVHPDMEITDYIGITYRVDGSGVEVFTSFTGMENDACDPPPCGYDQSLIWSSRIAWRTWP